MQRPRRTTEYETPSTAAKQSRPSRLQPPVRRPSIRRSSSAEPANSHGLVGNYLAVPSSSIKRQRSSSVSNVRTPQRTPTHITPCTNKISQFTGEKQRPPINDKRWIQDQVNKITEYLLTVDVGVNMDFLHRAGLKTMSIKQFIALVNYFLKLVAGNKFKIGPNHVESISKVLNQIDYPYTVTKSWLKTPTAPHAFCNAVMLFSFFMEFIPPADNLHSFKMKYLIKSEEFPDMDFVFKFFTMAEEGFALWNNQKNEEFEKMQRAAVGDLIFKKVAIGGYDEIEEEINRLNTELDRISSCKIEIHNEDEYFRMDKELKTNQRQIAKLEKVHQEKQEIAKNLECQIDTILEQMAKRQLRVDELRNVVETQEMSIEMRNDLIQEVGQLQYILKTKKQSVCDIQEMDHQNQVLLSRHIKQLTEKIAQFNSYIRQIKQDFENLDVDIESLCLHQNSKVELQDQIDDITVFLQRLQNHIASRLEKISKLNEGFESQFKLDSYEIAEWIEPKMKETIERLKEQQIVVDELDREIIAVKNYATDRVNEFSKKVEQTNALVDELKKTIKKNSEELVNTRKENEDMMMVVKQRFEESFNIRETHLNRFQEAMLQLRKKCTGAKALMK